MHTCAGRKYCWMILGGLVIALLLCITGAGAASGPVSGSPAVYLNFNEGSGNTALDASGHGNTGTIHGSVYRADNIGCVKALVLDGNANYVSIPYTSLNHPTDAITVSLWFYVADMTPQTLLSTYNNEGGYRLAFDDGNDLWWTINLVGAGDISVAVPHENIAPRQWHHVTGTYDGSTSRIYLDGVLRNQVNATGAIHYTDLNYVQVGADAGPQETPDENAPNYLTGGIDEVRIYNQALAYGDVMDDRFQCTAASGTGILPLSNITTPAPLPSGTLSLGPGQTAEKHLIFSNRSEEGIWHIAVPPGSLLAVRTSDAYSRVYPDEWYIELKDQDTRLTRAVAFPDTNNAPVLGTIASGNATVLVHYFGGPARFPAGVSLTFTCTEQKNTNPVSSLPKVILEYPIIVIYSASWATLIALAVVIFWVHKRRNKP